ncbi:Protein jagged-1a [Zootermopsis nevadensis]|uniref:Protein jagged-1a n=1 Tax=Zootermopsis nevadensis TaxID=136037 RepID=A0A067R5T4_ZOONE|nr:Protein jagged-1a [Zootermopsis nevadensis]
MIDQLFDMTVVFSLQCTCGSGFFELQILEIANYRSELASGACCGSESRPDSSVPCPRQCSTSFRVCLKEYQSNVTSTGSCSFGNTSSPVLGGSSFTLADPDHANGKLVVPFIFRWTATFLAVVKMGFRCLRVTLGKLQQGRDLDDQHA